MLVYKPIKITNLCLWWTIHIDIWSLPQIELQEEFCIIVSINSQTIDVNVINYYLDSCYHWWFYWFLLFKYVHKYIDKHNVYFHTYWPVMWSSAVEIQHDIPGEEVRGILEAIAATGKFWYALLLMPLLFKKKMNQIILKIFFMF